MNQTFSAGQEVVFAPFATEEIKIYGEGPHLVRKAVNITHKICACGGLVTDDYHCDEHGVRVICPHGSGFKLLRDYASHPQWVVVHNRAGKYIGSYFGTYFREVETEVA